VTADEILLFLNDNRIFDVSMEEARYLVAYFDTDEDMRLNYKE
jgi:hypothetical protein